MWFNRRNTEMGLTALLHRVSNAIATTNDGIFSQPVEKQKTYINHFKEPTNDYERSYYQYKCQSKLNRSVLISILCNLAALPLLIYYYFKPNSRMEESDIDRIFILDSKPISIVPESLLNGIDKPHVAQKQEMLSKEDKKFFRSIVIKHPFAWYFLLKCLINLRYYSYQIHCFHPKSIVVCHEYSFTSSLMTLFCETNEVLHINVMHGEKLFYMRDSFFRFSSCYVWDSFYIQLFKGLRADSKQFIIEIPSSMDFAKRTVSPNKIIDFKYYLGGESGDTLKAIVDSLEELRSKGYEVSLRPHPRYTNKDELKKLISKIEVEETDVSIEESILGTKYAISLYSTVLNQSYHNGVGIVIDDISDPVRYSKLAQLQYIMISKEHQLLSDLIR